MMFVRILGLLVFISSVAFAGNPIVGRWKLVEVQKHGHSWLSSHSSAQVDFSLEEDAGSDAKGYIHIGLQNPAGLRVPIILPIRVEKQFMVKKEGNAEASFGTKFYFNQKIDIAKLKSEYAHLENGSLNLLIEVVETLQKSSETHWILAPGNPDQLLLIQPDGAANDQIRFVKAAENEVLTSAVTAGYMLSFPQAVGQNQVPHTPGEATKGLSLFGGLEYLKDLTWKGARVCGSFAESCSKLIRQINGGGQKPEPTIITVEPEDSSQKYDAKNGPFTSYRLPSPSEVYEGLGGGEEAPQSSQAQRVAPAPPARARQDVPAARNHPVEPQECSVNAGDLILQQVEKNKLLMESLAKRREAFVEKEKKEDAEQDTHHWDD